MNEDLIELVRNRYSRICIVVLLLSMICLFPPRLSAEDLPELKAGDRLRIITVSHSAVYILDSIDSGVMTLHRDGGLMVGAGTGVLFGYTRGSDPPCSLSMDCDHRGISLSCEF